MLAAEPGRVPAAAQPHPEHSGYGQYCVMYVLLQPVHADHACTLALILITTALEAPKKGALGAGNIRSGESEGSNRLAVWWGSWGTDPTQTRRNGWGGPG